MEKGLDVGEILSGKTLHLFTGHQGTDSDGRYDGLGRLLNLPVKVHHLDDRGVTASLAPGRGAVIVIIRWCGHRQTDYIVTQCDKPRVPSDRMSQHMLAPERIVLELAGKV